MKRKYIVLLICSVILVLYGCVSKEIDPEKIIVPDDFTFSLTWNVYGISSYDSETGTLIKTTDATYPEDYVTTLKLSKDEWKEIYIKLTKDINIYSYKDKYNPFHVVSTPTQTIIVSITADGKSKTVTCKDIAFGEAKQARNKKGREFIEVIDEVVDIITNTEEWKSLPDYEFGYD